MNRFRKYFVPLRYVQSKLKIMQKKLFLMLVLLLITINDIWAEKYTVTLKSEYMSVPTIYAGAQNYFILGVENTSEEAASDVVARVFLDDWLVWEQTIDNLPAGENVNFDFVDPTIRPVTENTIHGHDNENVVYKVVVSDGVVSDIQTNFSFVVLYNGNLGKDCAYPCANPTLRDYTFTGDVLTLVGDGYSTNSATSRDEVFAIDLGGCGVHKALLYVSYNWDKAPDGDFNLWTATFNGQTISFIANYRDQGNLGSYGGYGYGMVVYDVTDAVIDGNNTFTLQKTAGNVAVYPSSLIVMVDNPSADSKAVYIVEEADLLSKTNNRQTDATYNSSFNDVADGDATLYVFAASPQSGEGDLVINGNLHSDIWSGTSNSVEVYETPVESGDVSVQFTATGSSILALQQMLVIKKTPTDIAGVSATSNKSCDYYDLSGRQLQGKPTKKGVYTQKGIKVLIR